MIRVRKPHQPPDSLEEDGRREATSNKRLYSRYSADYDAGLKVFEFKARIYASLAVKSALIAAQHDKCCFCESKISHVSYGDVEHFRPKKGYRQSTDEPLCRPGYYWLAYDWSNLFFSCQVCNQRYKRNWFPLKDATRRALSHNVDISQEDPLFVNPQEDDPTDFISFREEYPFPVEGSEKGKTTITALGLDREILAEHRRDRLEVLKLLKHMAESDLPEAEEARDYLEAAILDNAEYASMARSLLCIDVGE